MNSGSNKIHISTQQSSIVLDLDRLVSCESDNSKVKLVYSNNHTVRINVGLVELYDILLGKSSHFVKVSDKHIVNLRYISNLNELDDNILEMTNRLKIRISDTVRQSFINQLNKHY